MKAFSWSFLSVTVVSLALNTACGSKTEEKEDTAAATSEYTYAADTKAIIDANCATSGCHAAGSAYRHFTTLAEIKPYASTMITRIKATDSTRMPQDNTTFETSEDGVMLL